MKFYKYLILKYRICDINSNICLKWYTTGLKIILFWWYSHKKTNEYIEYISLIQNIVSVLEFQHLPYSKYIQQGARVGSLVGIWVSKWLGFASFSKLYFILSAFMGYSLYLPFRKPCKSGLKEWFNTPQSRSNKVKKIPTNRYQGNRWS